MGSKRAWFLKAKPTTKTPHITLGTWSPPDPATIVSHFCPVALFITLTINSYNIARILCTESKNWKPQNKIYPQFRLMLPASETEHSQKKGYGLLPICLCISAHITLQRERFRLKRWPGVDDTNSTAHHALDALNPKVALATLIHLQFLEKDHNGSHIVPSTSFDRFLNLIP